MSFSGAEGSFGAPVRLTYAKVSDKRGARETSPRFSPDGKSLVFLSYRETHELEMAPDLWIRDLGGNDIKRLTYGQGFVGQPAFSPDGKHMAFFGNVKKDVAAAKSEILVLSAKGERFGFSQLPLTGTQGVLLPLTAEWAGADRCLGGPLMANTSISRQPIGDPLRSTRLP